MRKSILAFFLAISITPVFAAHQVNISQLEQQLAAFRSKSDAEAAYAIGELQLTERLNAGAAQGIAEGLAG
jgi:hypothetical protein